MAETTGEATGETVAGPSYCRRCGAWPAYRDNRLCNICDDIEWCAEHPVPGGTNWAALTVVLSRPAPGGKE